MKFKFGDKVKAVAHPFYAETTATVIQQQEFLGKIYYTIVYPFDQQCTYEETDLVGV